MLYLYISRLKGLTSTSHKHRLFIFVKNDKGNYVYNADTKKGSKNRFVPGIISKSGLTYKALQNGNLNLSNSGLSLTGNSSKLTLVPTDNIKFKRNIRYLIIQRFKRKGRGSKPYLAVLSEIFLGKPEYVMGKISGMTNNGTIRSTLKPNVVVAPAAAASATTVVAEETNIYTISNNNIKKMLLRVGPRKVSPLEATTGSFGGQKKNKKNKIQIVNVGKRLVRINKRKKKYVKVNGKNIPLTKLKKVKNKRNTYKL